MPDARSLRLALDLFYPARLGAWERFQRGALAVTSLRETLDRQTGMYRVAGKLTDEQADTLVGRFCRSDGGCLRTILWKRDASGAPASTLLPREKFDPAHDQGGGPLPDGCGVRPVALPGSVQPARGRGAGGGQGRDVNALAGRASLPRPVRRIVFPAESPDLEAAVGGPR